MEKPQPKVSLFDFSKNFWYNYIRKIKKYFLLGYTKYFKIFQKFTAQFSKPFKLRHFEYFSLLSIRVFDLVFESHQVKNFLEKVGSRRLKNIK